MTVHLAIINFGEIGLLSGHVLSTDEILAMGPCVYGIHNHELVLPLVFHLMG